MRTVPLCVNSMGVLVAAYKELEERVGLAESQRGSKTAMIREAISRFPGTFTIQDIERVCPNVSRPTIHRVFSALKEEGAIDCDVSGRHARWRKK